MATEKPKYQLLGPPDIEKGGGQGYKNLLDDLSDSDGITRLQALLSEWLRMENLVVLTGAGCSVDPKWGGKTMGDLEIDVLDAVTKVYGLSKKTRKIIQQRLKDDNDRNKPKWAKAPFETWLSYLVNALHLVQEKTSPVKSLTWKSPITDNKDIEQLINLISKAIYAECALTLPDDENIPPHLTFLAKLVARDSTLGRAHLFTLNYDTLFEQALERLGIQYFDGFSGRADARFDPSVYGLDIHYPGEVAEGRVRRFDKFLHFYKLHGSIHWRVIKDDEIRAHHMDHRDLKKYEEYRGKLEKDRAKELCGENFAPDYKEFGILPTANKFVQTLEMPYAHLFKAFQTRLSTPQTFLMVLGYSFGDKHVNRIIETALTNPALIMLVLEPDIESAEEIIKKYSGLGNRVFVLTAKEPPAQGQPPQNAIFKDFAEDVLPDVQWLSDFIKLREIKKDLRDKGV